MALMRFATLSLLLTSFAGLSFPAEPSHWVVTWGASPSPPLADEARMRSQKLLFDNQTLREIIHTSIGGEMVRVRLSNAYGKESLQVGAAHVALRGRGSSIVPGSDRVLTFGGRPTVTIPPDAPVLSDPVRLAVPPAADLAISVFVPKPAVGAGIHYAALQTSYIGQGDLTGAAEIPMPATLTSWAFLTGVEVLAPAPASALVAFGDSITDGARSTVDANRRWPDVLAERLRARRRGKPVATLNAGIGGNRILHDPAGSATFGMNALARFDRDVLAQPGVKYVVILEGANDLGHPGSAGRPVSETVSAEDLIAGMKQMIERAHEHGLKVFGATLTPFEGTTNVGYFTPEKEVKRKAINDWIRNGKAFDGVFDFDKATRDPAHPDRMLPANDSGDHLHPSDAGYRAMGESIDLSLFP